MKHFKNQEGSTLLLVILTIAMLTVLGTSILAMSYMNVNMKFTNERMKKTLYYSESGIEQVYSIAAKYIDKALIDADEKTGDDIGSKETWSSTIFADLNAYKIELQSDELKKQISLNSYLANKAGIESKFGLNDITSFSGNYNPYDNTELSTEKYMNNGWFVAEYLYNYEDVDNDNIYQEFAEISFLTFEGNGDTEPYNLTLLPDTVSDYTKGRMEFYFKDFFDDYDNDNLNDMLNEMVLIDEYLDDNNESNNSKISVTIGDDPDDLTSAITLFGSTTTLTIENVKSEFVFRDVSRKSITTDIVIEAPVDVIPLNLSQNRVSVKDNPLWQYALVTHKDLTFYSSTAVIDGSVYALGTKPISVDYDSDDLRDPTNYDGIIVTGTGSDVTVNGDLISQSYIQLDESSINGNLTVNNGHVYCESMMIQSGSTGANINLNASNLYTSDDLELNGTDGDINIVGSYYGFMGTAKSYNRTSSIVINGDIADTSSLSISGSIPIGLSNVESSEGIFISGVSYVNEIFDPDPYPDVEGSLYQTGESMGIRGNYIAYAFTATDENSDYHVSKLNQNDLTLGTESGLNLYYKKKIGDTLLGPAEKRAYFQAIASDSLINSFLNLGNGNIDINKSAYKYTLGAVICNDSDGDGLPNVFQANVPDMQEKAIELEVSIAKDYVYIMNYLTHRPNEININRFFPQIDPSEPTSPVQPVPIFIERTPQATVIGNYSLLNSGDTYNVNEVYDISTKLSIHGSGFVKELSIVKNTNGDAIDNFLLIGDNAEAPYNTYATGDEVDYRGEKYYTIKTNAAIPTEFQGIVLTTGKVAFIGDIQFTGSIIAMEEIYFDSASDVKIINYDTSGTIDVKRYLAGLIQNDTQLNEVFNNVDSITNSELDIQLNQLEYIDNITINTGDINSLRQSYDEFLYYQNWSISE